MAPKSKAEQEADRKAAEAVKALRAAISAGKLGQLYVFCGAEQYLLSGYLGMVRKALVAEGFDEFNHKRLDGRSLTMQQLREAVDTVPAFAERTLVEVEDLDFSKRDAEFMGQMLALAEDLPEYVCLIFVYLSAEFKLDGRIKACAALKKRMEIVEFRQQAEDELSKWIVRHFREGGKKITLEGAEYLIDITGGSMNVMSREIAKVCAYASGETVTRADMDAVITPVSDAVIYQMTDALSQRRLSDAFATMALLLDQQEVPHRILFGVGTKLRQMTAACVLMEQRGTVRDLMDLCRIRYEFQARSVWTEASRRGFGWCHDALALCTEAAYSLNSSSVDPEDTLKQLLAEISAL